LNDAMEYNAAGMEKELYEGVPLIVLAGDKGEDVVHLLRTVYEHGYYISSSDDHPIEKITALLLLGTKYDFKDIRMDVMNHLLRHYPPSLSEFVAVNDDSAWSFQNVRCCHHFELLKVALAAEADSLLPGLYYACSDYPIHSIFNNLGKDLDALSLRTLLEGRELLAKAARSVQWIYITESERCVKFHRVVPQADFNRFRFEEPNPSEIFDTTNLKKIAGQKLSAHWPDRLCQACRPETECLVDEEREEVWGELPSYFGLPSWNILLARDALK